MTFTVPIINGNQVRKIDFLNHPFNATGEATLSAAATAFVTITDDDTGLALSSPVYVASGKQCIPLLECAAPERNKHRHHCKIQATDGTAIAERITPRPAALTFGNGETIKASRGHPAGSCATRLELHGGPGDPSAPAQPRTAVVARSWTLTPPGFTNADFPPSRRHQRADHRLAHQRQHR
jgi:hypothetical protein